MNDSLHDARTDIDIPSARAVRLLRRDLHLAPVNHESPADKHKSETMSKKLLR
jgi:hypothetical protein